MFWKVPKEKSNEFKFYEFIRDYHQKESIHNPKANINGDEDVMAVLDGQQRLASLYIGLKGSYAYKLAYKKRDNPLAYLRKRLYINLFGNRQDISYEYEFEFLTDTEARRQDENHHWFLVGKTLDLKEPYHVLDYLINSGLASNPNKQKALYANKSLSKLHDVIHVDSVISYYL